MITAYVSIGNSDDKLTQREWALYWHAVNDELEWAAERTHGSWLSCPAEPFQNACWCVEVDEDNVEDLKHDLAILAARYKQDTIAFAVATTEFIQAATEETA